MLLLYFWFNKEAREEEGLIKFSEGVLDVLVKDWCWSVVLLDGGTNWRNAEKGGSVILDSTKHLLKSWKKLCDSWVLVCNYKEGAVIARKDVWSGQD